MHQYPPHAQGLSIGIPLRGITQNCAKLHATVLELRVIVQNCAILCGIARGLQGSQLRASKIHLRWKPYSQRIVCISNPFFKKKCYERFTMMPQTFSVILRDIVVYLEKNWVFVTNSNFLYPYIFDSVTFNISILNYLD